MREPCGGTRLGILDHRGGARLSSAPLGAHDPVQNEGASQRSGSAATSQSRARSPKAGIRNGDIILSISQQPVTDVKSFDKVMSKLDMDKIIPVLVSRRGEAQRYFAVKIG